MGTFPDTSMPGHKELHERFCAALDYCEESTGVEFKQSAPWDDLKFKIVKTAMAMANQRDGGLIIIGVEEAESGWNRTGIIKEHLDTYDIDVISAIIHKYASPTVDLTAALGEYSNGKQFLVIMIKEFDDTPVVNKRDYPGELRAAEFYVRLPGPIRSAPASDAGHLQKLLELAAEKRATKIIKTAKHIGLEAQQPDKEKFAEEAKKISTIENAKSVQSLPHIKVAIRGEVYDPTKYINLSDLWQIYETTRIQRFGWRYPLRLNNDEYYLQGANWVGSWSELSTGPERWMLFQSGQYLHELTIFGCYESNINTHRKWAEGHNITPPEDKWENVLGFIGIARTVITFALIIEFASRLCQRGVIEGRCHIEISMRNIRDTMLVAGPDTFWHSSHMANEDTLLNTWAYPVDELIADPVTPPIDMATWFFERFGWMNPNKPSFQKIVTDLRGGN